MDQVCQNFHSSDRITVFLKHILKMSLRVDRLSEMGEIVSSLLFIIDKGNEYGLAKWWFYSLKLQIPREIPPQL